jgi:hypothetical protein
MPVSFVPAALLSAALIFVQGLGPQEHEHAAAEKLGTVHFATSCQAVAQPSFDRAVALLHSFEFGPAIAAFEGTLAKDPGCAMAQWGIAVSRWGNPFAVGVRSAAQIQQGREAIDRARAIGTKNDRERGYVEAAAQLFADAAQRPQPVRLVAYRDAMEKLAAAQRDDAEATIFYALSLTASEDPADKTYASRQKAATILEPLFAKHPDHPGLAHYLIHSYDVPALAPRALVAARRYASIAPSAPHALHMPSHTFTRIGSWEESIAANIASAASARTARAVSEELHATDYQMYAYLQTAQDASARRLVAALPEIVSRFATSTVASAAPPAAGSFAAAAIPARFALERGAWSEAARLQPQPSPVPYADALTYFARALGSARTGDAAGARAAVAELQRLRDREAQLNEPYWTEQIEIQRRGAAAWLAFAEGRQAEALAEMRATAEAEDRTEKAAVTPGPLAPARELVGDMLLEMNRPAEALKEYEATRLKEPNRFRTLYGAARAARLAGNAAAAKSYAAELLKICQHGDATRPELVEMRKLVGGT